MSFTMGPLKLLRLCFIIATCPPAVAAFQEPFGKFSARHFIEDVYRSPVGSDSNGFPSLSSWQIGPESNAPPTEVPRIQVSCTGSRLTLLVEKRFNGVLLSGEDLQLGDDCFHNGDSKENFVFTYDFARCGTNHVVTQNGLDVFYNLLHFIPRSPLTWWHAPFTVPVSCVPNRGATDFSFSVPLPSTSNDWSFTINAMKSSWTSTAESNLYQRGQSIHLQVLAKCGTEQRPFIQSCWLSKSIAPETRPRHAVILNKGCTVPSRSNHAIAQFVPSGRKDAINLILDTSPLKSGMYMHCSVVISDKGITVGSKSCNYNKLRSRWEELTDNAMVCICCRSKCKDHTRGISHIDAMALVSTGPFIVNGEPVRSRPPAYIPHNLPTPQPRVLSNPPASQPRVISHPPAPDAGPFIVNGEPVRSRPPAYIPHNLPTPQPRVMSNPPASQPKVISHPPAPQPRVISHPPAPDAGPFIVNGEPVRSRPPAYIPHNLPTPQPRVLSNPPASQPKVISHPPAPDAGPFIVNGEPVRSRPPAYIPHNLPTPQPRVLSNPPASQPRVISHPPAPDAGPFIVNGEPVRSRPPAYIPHNLPTPQPRVLSNPPASQPKVISHPPAPQPRVISHPPAPDAGPFIVNGEPVRSRPPAYIPHNLPTPQPRVLSNPPASQPKVISHPPAPQPRVISHPPAPDAVDYVYFMQSDEPAPEVNKYDASTSQSASGAQEGTISSENAIPGSHWLPVAAGASVSSQEGPAAILTLTLPGQVQVTNNNAPSTGNDVSIWNPTATHHPLQSPLKGLSGKRFNAIGSDYVTTGVPLTAEGFLIPLLDGWPIPPPPMLYGWPIPPPYHEVGARREEGLRRREEALRAIREESQRKQALWEREAFLREEAIRNRDWGGLSRMRRGQTLKEHNEPWPALVSPYIVNGEPVGSRPPAPQPRVLSHPPAPQPRVIYHPSAPDADFYLDFMQSDEPAPEVNKYDTSTSQSASGAQEGTISSENAIPGSHWLPVPAGASVSSQEGPAAILTLTLPGQVQVTNVPSTNDVTKWNPTATHHPLQSPLKGLGGMRFNAIGSDAVTTGVPLIPLIPLLDGWPIPPPPMLYGWPIPPPYHEVAARREEGLRRREEALRAIREESQRKQALREREAFLREEAIRNREWGGLSRMRHGQALNEPWPAYDLNQRGSGLDLNMGGQQADNEAGTTADGQPILRSRLQFETDADGSQTLSYEEETVKPGDGNRRTRTLGKDEDFVEKRTATGQRRLLSTFLKLLRKLDQRE